MKTTLLIALISATIFGCSRSPKSYDEMSDAEKLNYLRAQANTAELAEATNVVSDIRAVVEENADTFSDSTDQWRGWVRVDYATPTGIERTNIPMVFIATYDGRLFGCAMWKMDAPVRGGVRL